MPETICPSCGELDPDTELVDFGVGQYEYWGFVGFHRDEQWVTECCEVNPEPFLPEEPNPDDIPEGSVA